MDGGIDYAEGSMATSAVNDPLVDAHNPDRSAALRALGPLRTAPDPLLELICQLAADRFSAPIALVTLIDDSRQYFVSRYGLELLETLRSESLCMHAMASSGVLVISDALEDPRFRSNRLVQGDPHIRFYAGAPLVLSTGHCVGALCVIDTRPRKDFSKRERDVLALMARQTVMILESHLSRQERVFAHLIARTTSDAFVCSDTDGRIVLWNRGAQKMFGWASEEALGQSVDSFMKFHGREGVVDWLQLQADAAASAPGAPLNVDAQRKDGASIPVELSIATWSSEHGGEPSGVAAIIRDVSLTRKAQARLSEQIAALNASHDGIALTDAEGKFLFMNRAHAEMFGYASPDQLVGQAWGVLYPERELERLQREMLPVLATKGRWRGTTLGRKADGAPIEQEVTLSLSGQGGIVCITRDIGLRLALERDKARLAEALMMRQRQEVVGQLASGIAHDINNLVLIITGTTRMLEAHTDESVREHASRIKVASSTASRMVERLLTLGRRRQSRKNVDLCGVARDLTDLLRPSLKDRLHEIVTELPPTPIWSDCDETEVTQMVMNLLVNSRDALTSGVDGRIVLEVRNADGNTPTGPLIVGNLPRGPAALIKVSDNGCGIPPDVFPRIFEPFFSSKGQTGTGLGLAVAAGIANANGGAIAVSTTPGAGTSFEIWWPLTGDSLDEHFPVVAANADVPCLVGRTALVVDDNEIVIETVTRILEELGMEVGPCLDPADAVAALKQGADDWDLIITDYDMPGMNGYEFAQAARAIRQDLPILLISGLAAPRPSLSAETPVFVECLNKPLQPDQLKRAVRSAITPQTGRAS